MEREIDVENHASFKIFPSINRYEAYLCLNNEVERVADGYLDQLASHLYGVKQLCFNESSDYFKLEIPVGVKGATWVTKNTFKRFLCFIDSKDLITKAKVIEGEMSQLIERSQRSNGNIEGDGANSSDKPELGRPLLDASRNELLRAMDFRLVALRGELEETLSQAVGATSSICELNYLEKFCEHFGAMDMRNSVRKFVEVIANSQIPVYPVESSAEWDQISNGLNSLDHDTPSVMSIHESVDENHGIPHESKAIVDVQSSSGSFISTRNDTNINRAIGIPKKTTVDTQMRRSWPGRPANDNNDNNTRFPVVENVFRENVGGQAQVNQERSERRMSVKDVISHFESKQKEQSSCVQRRKSSDFSTTVNNSVLRRWSLGTGEASVKHPHENDCDECLTRNGSVSAGATGSLELKPEADEISSGHNSVEIESTEPEVKFGHGGETGGESHTIDTIKETCEISLISEENNQQETELEKTVVVMEKPEDRQPYFDNRGRLYDYYQGKRDQRLRENATKYSEMEERLRHLKLDLCSMEDETISINDSRRETKKNDTDELFKSHNHGSQLLCPKPDTLKKLPARTTSLPSRRKSGVSAPSPRAVSTKTPPEHPTDRPKLVNQRTPMPKSSPRPSTHIEKTAQIGLKVETAQNRPKNAKILQAQAANMRLKSTTDSQQKFTPYRKPVVKTKAFIVQGESPDVVRSSSSLSQKQAKKNSIVPLASKVAPRRRPETGSLEDPVKSQIEVEKEAEASSLDEIHGESVIVLGKKEADVDTIVATDEKIDDSDLKSGIQDVKMEEGYEEDATGRVSVDSDGDVEMAEDDMPAEVVIEECGGGVEETAILSKESYGVVVSEPPGQAAPVVSSASGRPATRQSLSQMLQEENSETENNEWGSGDISSNVVCQKDAPRGLKRLLKFAQKSIGTTNSTILSSPSVNSEGEEDAVEPKVDALKNSENTISKCDTNASLNKTRKGTNSVDQLEQQRLQEDGVFMSRTSSTKAKSFFSLSAFRTSKQGGRRHT